MKQRLIDLRSRLILRLVMWLCQWDSAAVMAGYHSAPTEVGVKLFGGVADGYTVQLKGGRRYAFVPFRDFDRAPPIRYAVYERAGDTSYVYCGWADELQREDFA